MGKKLLYLLIASVIGAFVYLRSFNYAYLAKEIELMKKAFSDGAYSDYLGYANPYFRERHGIDDPDFRIAVYEVVIGENGRAKTAYAVFVSRLNEEKFRISEDLYDKNDRTDLTVYDEELAYSYLEEMKLRDNFLSQSYGYREYRGYYYLFFPEKEAEYDFVLSDYDGQIFSEFSLEHKDAFPKNSALGELETLLGNDWERGFGQGQKISLVRPLVNRNMLIYGAAVILFGIFLFRKSIFKKRK